jgi:hypothetical protein
VVERAGLLVLVLLLVVPACGPHGETQTFMAPAADSVWYLEWQRAGASVEGDVRRSTADAGSASGVSTIRDAFSGVVHGAKVTLTFDRKMFSPEAWTGSLSEDSVTLTYLQADREAATLYFRRVDGPSYGLALRALAPPSETPAADVTEGRIDKDIKLVRDDLRSLERDVDAVELVLSPMEDLLSSAQDWVRTAAHAANEAELRVNPERVCQFAGETSSAAAQVATYTSRVLDGVATARTTLEEIRADMDRLGGHHAKLAEDLLALPAYRPSGTPTDKEISDAIESGAAEIREADPAANRYESSANAKASLASQYAADAQAQCAQG